MSKIIILDASQVSIVNKPHVVGLPDELEIAYFGVMGNKAIPFVIAQAKDAEGYEGFICIIDGKATTVKKVERYRDGGTTNVFTDAGQFHFPTPFKPEEKSWFAPADGGGSHYTITRYAR